MYGKAIVAILAAVLIAMQAATGGDHHVQPDEWLQIGIAAVSAASVYLVPLTTRYKWTKTAMAFLLAALQAAATLLLGGWESNDWITVAIAGLGAIGVLVAPATSIDPSGAGNVRVPVGADR
jgi:divalent metal cation (Fe/Co/Zn/Cd) transporter